MKINHTGEKYNCWTILSETLNEKVQAQCKCGKTKEMFVRNIIRGLSTNCGCVANEKIKKRMSSHGESKTKLYGVWLAMRNRCYLKTSKSYNDYGGRGIRVTERWQKSYEAFRDWSIKNGYKEGLQIDRTNNNGNYEPENCKWVTRLVNANNTRRNVFITIDDITHTESEWGRIANIKGSLIRERVSRGWQGKLLLIKPVLGRNQTFKRECV